MRTLCFTILALFVVLSAGCGSGSRATSSPAVVPVPIPGDYVGTFSLTTDLGASQPANVAGAKRVSVENVQTGTVSIQVASDGTLTGQFINTTSNLTGVVSGTLTANAAINVTTTYQTVTYSSIGNLTYVPASGSTPDSLSGTVNAYEDETAQTRTAVTQVPIGTLTLHLTTGQPV